MKFLILFVTLILLSACGKEAESKPSRVGTLPLSNNACVSKGYVDGEIFLSDDGCNTCICEGGRVMCTLKACSNMLGQ